MSLISSSLSSDTSVSSRVTLGRSNASTLLSVLNCCSLAILALTLSSLGVDTQRGIDRRQEKGEKVVLCLVRRGGEKKFKKEGRTQEKKVQ